MRPRLEGFLGRDSRDDFVVVPRLAGFGWLLHLGPRHVEQQVDLNGACVQAGSENAVTSAANSTVVSRVIGASPQVAPNLDFAATFEIFSDWG